MAFFQSAVGTLQTLVIALGAGLGIWGAINLMEGYGNDNPGAKSQGMKQLRDIVTKNLNTDFTAKRMIGYLSHYQHPTHEEIADEMLAILNDRNRIMHKKDLEKINASWNNYMMQGFSENEA